ncbi:MAG: carbohydrate ABC transporter permease, partial [Pseudomonadota bacterium]
MASKAQRMPTGLRLASSAFIIFWLIIAAFPFFWTFWGSFKVELDFFSIADWTNALVGRNTEAAHGTAFTGAGYDG